MSSPQVTSDRQKTSEDLWRSKSSLADELREGNATRDLKSAGTRVFQVPYLNLEEMKEKNDISGIKALSMEDRTPMGSMASQTASGLTTPRDSRMVVLSAGQYGKSPPKRTYPRTPRSKKDGSTSSGRSAAVDVLPEGISPDMPKRNKSPVRELDRLAIEAKAPPRFICPISGRVMRDPVILVTGTTCDRCALERRLAKGNKRCPVTNKNLRLPISMTPNAELRQSILVWAKKNATWLLDNTGAFLVSDEPHRHELQGTDPQYVNTGLSGTPNRTPSRISMGKGGWTYTNGSKVRPGAYNMNATPGSLEAGRSPWYMSRGIASPRSSRKAHSRKSSGSRRSGQPSSSKTVVHDWFSLGFLCIMSAVYLGMFLLSLSFSDWKIVSLSENPWYGASSQALVDSGAAVLTLMEGPSQEWWRLFSSIFLPAGMIQMFICIIFLWIFGHYCRTSLRVPQVSLPCLFLVSSIIGSLASVNLNAKYVSCGAFSGICSLLSCIIVDQSLTWPRRKLMNLKEWWIVALILVLGVGAFITISLLPLVDVWFTIGGMLGGLFLTLMISLFGRGKQGEPKRATWLTFQIISWVALIALIVAGAVGCALPTKVGESVGFLEDASCVEFSSSSLQCTPFGFIESGCGLTWNNSAKEKGVYLACPDSSGGYSYIQTNATFGDIGDDIKTKELCIEYCSGRKPIDIISLPPDTDDLIPVDADATSPTEAENQTKAPAPSLIVDAKAPSIAEPEIVPVVSEEMAPTQAPPAGAVQAQIPAVPVAGAQKPNSPPPAPVSINPAPVAGLNPVSNPSSDDNQTIVEQQNPVNIAAPVAAAKPEDEQVSLAVMGQPGA